MRPTDFTYKLMELLNEVYNHTFDHAECQEWLNELNNAIESIQLDANDGIPEGDPVLTPGQDKMIEILTKCGSLILSCTAQDDMQLDSALDLLDRIPLNLKRAHDATT